MDISLLAVFLSNKINFLSRSVIFWFLFTIIRGEHHGFVATEYDQGWQSTPSNRKLTSASSEFSGDRESVARCAEGKGGFTALAAHPMGAGDQLTAMARMAKSRHILVHIQIALWPLSI